MWGGANVIDKISCNERIASDNNSYLIELMWNRDRVTGLPEIVTKDLYDECRAACKVSDFSKYPKWYIAALGFFASYSGKFYDGGFNGTSFLAGRYKRNYYDEARRNFLSQLNRLNKISFLCGDYEELHSDKSGCLIYCDIPYKGTTQYSTSIGFDYERFWNWAEKMSENNIVLVSEYNAPDGWKSIWQMNLPKTLNHGNNVNGVEKLFILDK